MQTVSIICGVIVEIVHTMLINYDVCGQQTLKMAGSEEKFAWHSWHSKLGNQHLFLLPKKSLTNQLHHLTIV